MFNKPKPPTHSNLPDTAFSGVPPSGPFARELKPAKLLKVKENCMKNFFFGVATATSVIFATALAFVLFCPLWQEWRHPEPPKPQIHVKTTVEAPKVYMLPMRAHVVNRGNEKPAKAAPKMKKP